MRFSALILLAATAVPGPAQAQAAAYTLFGQPCLDSTQRPVVALAARTLPRLGTTLVVATNPAVSHGSFSTGTVLLHGVSNTTYRGLRLPFDLTTIDPTHFCGWLHVSMDFVQPRTDRTGIYRIPVPNAPALLGQTFFQQAVQITSSKVRNFVAYATSRGARARIGR